MIFNGDQYKDDWRWWLDTTIPILKEENQIAFWKIWHKVVKTSPIQMNVGNMFAYFDNALTNNLTGNGYAEYTEPYRFIFRSAEDRLSFTAELQSILQANSMAVGYIKTGELF